VIFDGQKSLNLFNSYKVSGRDSRDPKMNDLLKSLVDKRVEQVELSPDKLLLHLSAGTTLSVEGDIESDPDEFFSFANASGSSDSGFHPSMELTDAFSNSLTILKHLQTSAENTVNLLGLTCPALNSSSSGDTENGKSYYLWLWTLSKDSTRGAETFQLNLRISFKQADLSPMETPVTFEWMAEIFRKGQQSWFSRSGSVSKSFKDIQQEGLDELIRASVVQADAALEGREL
jgi:hypothetical protein